MKKRSLETERMKTLHGLEDAPDVIVVEHSNTISVVIQMLDRVVRLTLSCIFIGFCLLGLASVCFPGPREEMIGIWTALISQLQEYLPFLDMVF